MSESKKSGRPTDTPLTQTIKLRVDEETNEKLSEYCEKNGVNRSEVIRKALVEYVEEKPGMHLITVDVGCTYSSRKVPYSRPIMEWESNVNSVYGISALGTCKSKRVSVEVPDWVVTVAKWGHNLARPGYSSRAGYGDMCFVVCNESAKYVGTQAPDQEELIDAAIASGFKLIYPDENGDMASMPVRHLHVENAWEKHQHFRDDVPTSDSTRIDCGIRHTVIVHAIGERPDREYYVITERVTRRMDSVSTLDDRLESDVPQEELFRGSEQDALTFLQEFQPDGNVLYYSYITRRKIWVDVDVHKTYCDAVGIPNDDGSKHIRIYTSEQSIT